MGAALITPLIGSISSAFSAILGQHILRQKDATSENQAAAQLAPAIQQDFQQIASALQSGQLSQADAVAYLQQAAQYTEHYLRSQVGKPGTAWTDGAPCGKTCTVGCCLWGAYWRHAFSVFIQRIQSAKPGDTVGVVMPAIPTNKYGFPGAPGFTVNATIPQPNSVSSIVSQVTSPLNLLLGTQQSPSGNGSDGTPVATPSGAIIAGSPQGITQSKNLLYIAAAAAFGFLVLLVALTRR